jgi:hypothetical protein
MPLSFFHAAIADFAFCFHFTLIPLFFFLSLLFSADAAAISFTLAFTLLHFDFRRLR